MLGRVPPDFDEVTRRVEPDNGIWPLARACAAAQRMIVHRSFSVDLKSTPELDEEFATAVRQAVKAPRLEHHWLDYQSLGRSAVHPSGYRAAWDAEGAIDLIAGHRGGSSFTMLESFCEALTGESGRMRSYIRTLAPLLGREVIDGYVQDAKGLDLERIRIAWLGQEAARLDELRRISWRAAAPVPEVQDDSAWGRLAAMRGENVRNPELPARYAAAHAVSEMRLAFLATALVLLAASALLGLRLIPQPAAPALMDRALTPLLRGGFAGWLLPASTLALLIGGWWAFAHTSLDAERLTLELLLPTVSICSLTLGIVLQAARFHLNHRLASAGMAVGRKRLLVGLAWLLPLLAASDLIF